MAGAWARAKDPSGYVVSSSPECVLVIADRPDGPPVETVQEASGGRFGTCGGLDENDLVYYDPGEGIQVPSPGGNEVGFIAFPVFTLLAGVPGAGYSSYRGEAVADHPVGYVVSDDTDCTLVLVERPDGPPVETVQQTFGKESNLVGIAASFVAAALAGVPGAPAWTHTLQKRRARRRSASHTPGDRPRH